MFESDPGTVSDLFWKPWLKPRPPLRLGMVILFSLSASQSPRVVDMRMWADRAEAETRGRALNCTAGCRLQPKFSAPPRRAPLNWWLVDPGGSGAGSCPLTSGANSMVFLVLFPERDSSMIAPAQAIYKRTKNSLGLWDCGIAALQHCDLSEELTSTEYTWSILAGEGSDRGPSRHGSKLGQTQ